MAVDSETAAAMTAASGLFCCFCAAADAEISKLLHVYSNKEGRGKRSGLLAVFQGRVSSLFPLPLPSPALSRLPAGGISLP